MKKFIAAILVLTLVLAFASVAMAARTPFHIVTDSTSIYQVGTPLYTRVAQSWYLDIDTSTSNVAPDHRAVTRVHLGVNAASATWVYSGANGTSHGYNSNIGLNQEGLTFRGRLDNRDSGTLQFHGTVHH